MRFHSIRIPSFHRVLPRSNSSCYKPSSVQVRSFSNPSTMALFRSPTLFSPFSVFDQDLDNTFSSPFRELINNPFAPLGVRGTQDFFRNDRLLAGPRVDLHEEDNKFVLSAELPGFKKQDVKINVDAERRRITLEGQIKSEYHSEPSLPVAGDEEEQQQQQVAKPAKDESKQVAKSDPERKAGHAIVSERSFGHFSRSFILPATANLTNEKELKARFADGLLKLEIPKKAEEVSKPRQITIETD